MGQKRIRDLTAITDTSSGDVNVVSNPTDGDRQITIENAAKKHASLFASDASAYKVATLDATTGKVPSSLVPTVALNFKGTYTPPAALPLSPVDGDYVWVDASGNIPAPDGRAVVIGDELRYADGSWNIFSQRANYLDGTSSAATARNSLVVRGSFGAVSALVADTTLSYSNINAGEFVQADDYTYTVAAGGATDQHLTTAGGVKLYVADKPRAHVKAFGAVGQTGTDDLTAIRAAIDSKLPLDWGNSETYEVSDDIANGATIDYCLDWLGVDSAVKLVSASHRQALCSFTIDSQVSVKIDGLTLDSDLDANRGLEVRTADGIQDAAPRLWLTNFKAKNNRRLDATYNGLDGVYVSGSYDFIHIGPNFEVDNIRLAAGAGISGVVGAAGVTVTHANSGTNWAVKTLIEDFKISNVKSEDLSYHVDQDGFRAFGPWTGQNGEPSNNAVVVRDGEFRNVYGRAAKFQANAPLVDNVDVFIDEGLDAQELTTLFDSQITGGTFRNIFAYIDGPYGPAYLIRVGGRFGVANVAVLPEPASIDNCNMYLKNGAIATSHTLAFSSLGLLGMTSITNCMVNGGSIENFARFYPVGEGASNTFMLRNCTANNFRLYADETNTKAFVHARRGRAEDTTCYVSIEGCSYTGTDTDVYLAESETVDSPTEIKLNAISNFGFARDYSLQRKDEGLQYCPGVRADAIYPETDRFGLMRMYNITLAAGVPQDLDARIFNGSLFLLCVGSGPEGSALFSANPTLGCSELVAKSHINIGALADPGSGLIRVWVEGDKVRLLNTHVHQYHAMITALIPA